MSSELWLVTYKGQTESPYTWWAHSYGTAKTLKFYLERGYPEREWSIVEKDVS